MRIQSNYSKNLFNKWQLSVIKNGICVLSVIYTFAEIRLLNYMIIKKEILLLHMIILCILTMKWAPVHCKFYCNLEHYCKSFHSLIKELKADVY